uniref:Uncharacterized protein n=1 Tax=Arundo donax TaxID=35708 RepID=A0A0A9FXJ4_ARUDO
MLAVHLLVLLCCFLVVILLQVHQFLVSSRTMFESMCYVIIL